MAVVPTITSITNTGSQLRITGRIAFDSSYVTGGEPLTARSIRLSQIDSINLQAESGYFFQTVYPTVRPPSVNLMVFEGGLSAFTPAGSNANTSAGTPAGTNGTSAVTGTAAAQIWTAGAYTPGGSNSSSLVTGTADAQAFTGTAPLTNLDLATPAFSGTGLTAAGQVITTTDNQTMTLNQCAGMWLVSATEATAPNLIKSNTAVSGAPAVLTVYGSANTDAGAYKIVKHAAPVGTNGSSSLSGASATGQTFSGNLAVLSGTNSTSAVTGTAAAQTFTGSALATHTHVFSGTPVAATVATQVANATNLSALSAVEFEAFGW